MPKLEWHSQHLNAVSQQPAITYCPTNTASSIWALKRGNQSIYLHRGGPLLENGLDKPKNRCGRYGFPSFYSISIFTVGVDGARVCL